MHPLVEKAFSIVDEDIASEYRQLGEGGFWIENMVQLQICRDLKKLVQALSQKKRDYSSQSKDNSSTDENPV